MASCMVNGLRVEAVCEPDATRSAALFRLAAGSFDEPASWPGLAHLLEHVLFAGSGNFQDEQRLMAWAPANGARLNATTLAHSTAWFVEVAPEQLNEALCRLTDMLARPLLAAEAIAAESAAIDAEYRMLQSHEPTLCEAALSLAFTLPNPLQDFHVGSRQHFGDDAAALQQALHDYHRQFFHSGNLELWLTGPQPLAELNALAEKAARAFFPASSAAALSATGASSAGALFAADASSARALPATEASSASALSATGASSSRALVEAAAVSCHPDTESAAFPLLKLSRTRTFALQSQAAEHLQISFLVGNDPAAFSLLQELLLDKAPGSLLATLRAKGLCDDILLLEPYRSPRQSVLSVQFHLSGLQPQQCAEIEAVFCRWLAQLPDLTQAQLLHYTRLAQRRFSQLASLDRLRALAFGFPPASEHPATLLTQLHAQNMSRLWVSPAVSAPLVQAQGFALRCRPFALPAVSSSAPVFTFYSPVQEAVLPELPATRAALRTINASGESSLLLSLQPGQQLSRRTAATIEAALQPVMGECLHRGGELSFTRQHGLWLLRLSGKNERLINGLHQALNAFRDCSATTQAFADRLYRKAQQTLASDIAVRCLLAYLPDLLNGPPDLSNGPPGENSRSTETLATAALSTLRWQATYYGSDAETADRLARLLSQLPGSVVPPSTPPVSLPAQPRYFCPTQSPDAAAIIFCPLVTTSAESFASWQLLAALLAPRFFQQLRVEQNIGYVVSCRFQQMAGQAGLLFALQSPSLTTNKLFHHIDQFIFRMADTVAAFTTEALQESIASLARALPAASIKNSEQVSDHWLHQQLNLPLDVETYRQLSSRQLRQAYQQLSTGRCQWWRLSNS
ncbi:insulinase family protein [Erwinia sp. BNK-24-b]|uniref:insulinase family protein n=1 Tax=unclassified Erwinia TaxID=2622719 RepID=UPI0039BF9FBB